MARQDRLAEQYLRLCEDEYITLEEHDRREHGGQFDPETMSCSRREKAKRRDKADEITRDGARESRQKDGAGESGQGTHGTESDQEESRDEFAGMDGWRRRTAKRLGEILEMYRKNGFHWNEESLKALIEVDDSIAAGISKPLRMPGDSMEDGKIADIPQWFRCLYHALAYNSFRENQFINERLIKSFCESLGLWDELQSITLRNERGKCDVQGCESDVYFNGTTVIKDTTLALTKDPVAAMERIMLNNYYCKASRYQIEGMGFSSGGTWADDHGYSVPGWLLRQPKLELDERHELTSEEIEEYMKSLGFKRSPEKGKNNRRFISEDGTIYAADCHCQNVVRLKSGEITFVDSCFTLNTKLAMYDLAKPPEKLYTGDNQTKGE